MLNRYKQKDVAEKVLFGELFILDVRNEADYEDWKIEGKQVSSINKPYFDLLDGVIILSVNYLKIKMF